MLKQIKSIQGVGLFLASGPSPELERISLFYGENGRGKSTLASVLRACAEKRTDLIQSRQTLDAQVPRPFSIFSAEVFGTSRLARKRRSAGMWNGATILTLKGG